MIKNLNIKNVTRISLIFIGIFSASVCWGQKEEGLGLEPIEDPSKPIFFTVKKEKWQPAPAHFPPGVELMVLEGNPQLPTAFTMRLKLPANHEIRAHWHPSDEHATIISGHLMMGLGDKLDKHKKSYSLPAGSYMRIPAKMHHYGWTTEETVIQLMGHGPWHVHFLETDKPEQALGEEQKHPH